MMVRVLCYIQGRILSPHSCRELRCCRSIGVDRADSITHSKKWERRRLSTMERAVRHGGKKVPPGYFPQSTDEEEPASSLRDRSSYSGRRRQLWAVLLKRDKYTTSIKISERLEIKIPII